MEPENKDQQVLDQQVSRATRRFLPVAGVVVILAALVMSLVALTVSANHHTTTMMQSAPTRSAGAPVTGVAPESASVMIDHVTKGCHTLAINGGMPGAPSATVHLAPGGILEMQNNDVMPHELVLKSASYVQIVQPMMDHMGAKSAVTFLTPGVYHLTTKAGEDYMKGVTTTGSDNVLRIKVIVS